MLRKILLTTISLICITSASFADNHSLDLDADTILKQIINYTPAKLTIADIELVKCPAGSFKMGSPSNESGAEQNEVQHEVIISKGFLISKYPITQSQYKKIMGINNSKYQGDNNPVDSVSWTSAKEFCDRLNDKFGSNIPVGYKFDLPTEAQWEYACRANTNTQLNSGKNLTIFEGICTNLDEVGWYKGNAAGKTHPVGCKKPNAWGIYDMHGNVYEWCRDSYSFYFFESVDPYNSDGEKRVARGGSKNSEPKDCRAAYRLCVKDGTYVDAGFRIVLENKY